tara:strand:+ start:973 stop:1749 length:777 start_codon:yes stop_codon:yes gene_type:complete
MHNELKALEPFYFTADAIQRIASITLDTSQQQQQTQQRTQTQTQTLVSKSNINTSKCNNNEQLWNPPHKDKLFWAFYRIMYDEYTYLEACKHAFSVEQDVKIAAVEKLRQKKAEIKKCGFKLPDLESELVSNIRLNDRGLYALCIAYSVPIILIKNKVFIEINGMEDTPFQGIINTSNRQTLLSLFEDSSTEPPTSIVKNIQSTRFEIVNMNKPIRAMSGYSLIDLKDIANRLDIPERTSNDIKKTKKVLYDEIVKSI